MRPFNKKRFYTLHRVAKFIAFGLVILIWALAWLLFSDRLAPVLEINVYLIAPAIFAILASLVIVSIFSSLFHALINRFFGLPPSDEVPNISFIARIFRSRPRRRRKDS